MTNINCNNYELMLGYDAWKLLSTPLQYDKLPFIDMQWMMPWKYDEA